MKKIPTIFERDWTGDRSRVIDKPHPDCAWVFAGEGVATRKLDGTCCMIRGRMIRDSKLFRRRELRGGQPEPPGFEEVDRDAETGKIMGWVPVGDGPEDKWHRAVMRDTLPDGTYELIGPHSQGNPERVPDDILASHAETTRFALLPRTFNGIRDWFETRPDIEGIVFHHPDGRMGKIKLRDFGLKRGGKI